MVTLANSSNSKLLPFFFFLGGVGILNFESLMSIRIFYLNAIDQNYLDSSHSYNYTMFLLFIKEAYTKECRNRPPTRVLGEHRLPPRHVVTIKCVNLYFILYPDGDLKLELDLRWVLI